MTLDQRMASCRCGGMTLAIAGPPIMAAICCCQSCQKAGAALASLPGAPGTLDADGGTAFVLYRKDRVVLAGGVADLRAYRLTPQSPTRRVVARCCNTPMFLEFSGGHWLSVYRDRLGDTAPPVELRTMTGDRRAGVEFRDGLPGYKTHSARFMWRLLAAWAVMGFRAPKLPPIETV